MSNRLRKNNTEKSKPEKTAKNTLTDLRTASIVKTALRSPQANQHFSRNTQGGKTDIQKPPMNGGFFISALPSGAYNSQSGGRKYKILSGQDFCSDWKMRGVTLCTLENTRQLYGCQLSKNIQGITAMNNANTHGTATPVAAKQGTSSDQSNDCLLPFSVLPDAINTAKQQAAEAGKHGTGNAYADLLKQFHASIFPYLIQETSGNIALIARLLGVHRDSVIKYAGSVGLYDQLGAGQGGVRS